MSSEYEAGVEALKEAVAQEQARIEAYRPGRHRPLFTPKRLPERPGGGVFVQGKATSLEELRDRDAKGLQETIKLFSHPQIEPTEDGLWLIGGDPKDPDYGALDEVVDQGLKCSICKKDFSDCQVGEVVVYGEKPYHFDCLLTRILYACNGDEYEASRNSISLLLMFKL